MTREEALQILITLIKNENLVKHHLACEIVMRDLSRYFSPGENSEEEDKWGLVGLLHDADYELTHDNPKQHTLILEQKLQGKVAEDIIYAIKSHNWKNNGVEPKSKMDWSLYCCDELTGLIIAAALIHPDKKLASLTADFILKRFKEKSFAKGANRNQIKTCEKKLGIPLKDFIDINLKAMQKISAKLDL